MVVISASSFVEAFPDFEIVSALLRQLFWTLFPIENLMFIADTI